MPPEVQLIWNLIDKGGTTLLLVLNVVVLWKFGVKMLEQIASGEWVPAKYYVAIEEERDRLRAQNDAYRAVTLRAVGVAERLAPGGEA